MNELKKVISKSVFAAGVEISLSYLRNMIQSIISNLVKYPVQELLFYDLGTVRIRIRICDKRHRSKQSGNRQELTDNKE
ncbi:hypothetical protein HanIR_Chr01g0005501 [Helianthus annuus]|nr:hypothetical protein HanIR_Chr01g0005501 [Helianthus annuus]